MLASLTCLDYDSYVQQASGGGVEPEQNLVLVRIATQHAVNYGEIIRIVGSGGALGDWNPEKGAGTPVVYIHPALCHSTTPSSCSR